MKKLAIRVLVLVLAVSSMFAITACGNEKEITEVEYGMNFSFVDKKVTNESGKTETDRYAVLTKYTLSEDDAKKVSNGDFSGLEEKRTLTVDTAKDPKTGKDIPVKEIAAGALANQLLFTEVVFAPTVEKIGTGCLEGCTNLKKITVPFVGETVSAVNDAKVIGYLFGTTEVTGATKITQNYNSTGTKDFYIPDSLETVVVTGSTLSDYAFNATAIENVVLEKAEAIGTNAFAKMTTMGSIEIPASVKSIGVSAFAGCTNLYKISFTADSKLSSIAQEAFSGCTNLGLKGGNNEVKLPSSVSSIGARAFKGCTEMLSIDLTGLSSLTEIPSYCFYGCTKLTECKYDISVALGTSVFEGTKVTD